MRHDHTRSGSGRFGGTDDLQRHPAQRSSRAHLFTARLVTVRLVTVRLVTAQPVVRVEEAQ